MYKWNGDLHLGGSFQVHDSTNTCCVAKWNGSQLDSLGNGDGRATAFEEFNGELIAGGAFNQMAGLIFTENIAKWNGTNWLSLDNDNPNGQVQALKLFNNELYVGGNIGMIGPVVYNSIARWDGSQWSDVDGGLTGAPDHVDALTIYDNKLIAGGSFTWGSGGPISYIGQWDGNSWSNLGTGMGGTVWALITDTLNNTLYVGGDFYSAGGTPAHFIAGWDGSQWFSIGDSNSLDCNVYRKALSLYHGELYAGGCFTTVDGNAISYIARWDGRQWKDVGGGTNVEVESLAEYHDTLFVGGYFNIAGSKSALYLAKWHTPPCAALQAFIGLDEDTFFITNDSIQVQFYDSSASLNRNQWWWDFGDGDSANVKNPLHWYSIAGTYQVEMIVGFSYDGCLDTIVRTVVVIDITGINQHGQKDIFTIHPNPSTGSFTVSGAGEIQVYDLFGRLVLRTNNREIDMGSYPKGIYMVRVGEATRKISLY